MLNTRDPVSALIPNQEFAKLASNEQIERTAKALEANGIHTLTAENREEAEKMVFDLLPEGAEVFTATSQTLETLGIKGLVEKSGRYEALRPKMFAMDRETQGREIRKLGATLEYILGSVHAVTEDGRVLIASMSGTQLAPYAAAAAKVIWVVGAQKLVKDFDEGMSRVEEYAFPLEDKRVQAYGIHSGVNKVLIVNKEISPGRITMIIVKEELGY